MRNLIIVVAFVAACGFSKEVPPDAVGSGVTIGFEKPTSVVDRKTGIHQIRVKISEVTTHDVTVKYQIAGGTAVPPTDFDLVTPETLTIPAGQQFVSFEVRINPVADADRPDQTIDVTLVNPVGAQIAFGLENHVITILAKALPRVSFEVDQSTALEPADAVIKVKLDEMSEFDVTVDYTVTPMGTYTIAGQDYSLANGTLTIPKGMIAVDLTLDVLQDALDEDDEDIRIDLENPTKAFIDMAKATHTHRITDEDPLPVVQFQATTSNQLESAGAVNVVVTLTPVSGRPVTVGYALDAANSTATGGGTDFTIAGTSVTILPSATTADVPVTIVQDTTDEPNETLEIDLGTLTNANAGTNVNHRLTILDDDQVCYGAAPFAVCLDSPPTGAQALPATINTSAGGSALCAGTQPTNWTVAPQNQPAACFILKDTITVPAGTVTVTGNRPLVLVAATSITVTGTLDVSSNTVAGSTGAASPSGDCDAFVQAPNGSASGGGGGAGATFVGSIGGPGGTGDGGTATQAGIAPAVETTPVPKLRAGCDGQPGGNGGTGNNPGAGGRGGGSAYLLSGGTLSLDATAVINASGAGGNGGAHFTGGSGGGSGGMIELFATGNLNGTAGAVVMSNGGGGSSGGDNNANGTNGSDPSPATPTGQAGGAPSGGAGAGGGAGFGGGVAAVTGGTGGSGKGGGGGGGGGGYVQSNKALTNVTVSAGVIQIP